MPKYVYKCEKCKKNTCIICSYSNKSKQEISLKCEHCGHNKLYQLFGANFVSKESNSSGNSCGSCSSTSCGTCG